jgi:F-type H+-transporting ATPase subunit delta
MVSSAIASRYASALADVVMGRAAAMDPQQAAGELRAFAQALASSPELENALTSPAVPPARKRAVISRIGDRIALSRPVRNFLFVLVDHRRVSALSDIVETFELELDERLGFTRAEIVSAAELSDRQRAAVVAQLEHVSGKRVRPRFARDENLIGGLVARIGSTVYDGSVRAQLESLSRRLTE